MNMLASRPVHISLGAYGRLSHDQAITAALASPPIEPLLGTLNPSRLQLCPQNRGRITVDLANQLRQDYPGVEWRLHANIHVWEQRRVVDLCDWPDARAWFKDVGRVSATLQAPAYTAHAGKRAGSSVSAVIAHVREIEQLFGIPVGIEGHYPTPRDTWLFSSWEEYRLLLESGVHYALDLSHLHILAVQSGCIEWGLVKEMLASEQCLEVHVSGNDGWGDQHRPLDSVPWWFSLLQVMHPDAVVFSESRHYPVPASV